MVQHDKIQQTLMHIFMILLVLSCVLPFLLMVMASLTEEMTLTRNGYSFSLRYSAWRLTAILSGAQVPYSEGML